MLKLTPEINKNGVKYHTITNADDIALVTEDASVMNSISFRILGKVQVED